MRNHRDLISSRSKAYHSQVAFLSPADVLPTTIKRIAISRDTPFAQARFAKEAKLEDIQYLSDYPGSLEARVQ